jgi:hypothetical protein
MIARLRMGMNAVYTESAAVAVEANGHSAANGHPADDGARDTADGARYRRRPRGTAGR